MRVTVDDLRLCKHPADNKKVFLEAFMFKQLQRWLDKLV